MATAGAGVARASVRPAIAIRPQTRMTETTPNLRMSRSLRQGRAEHETGGNREERDAEGAVGQVDLRLSGGDARHPHPAGQPHDEEMRRDRKPGRDRRTSH
jgi:hypothetical protein